MTRDQKKQVKAQLVHWYGDFIRLGNRLKRVFESFGIFVIIDHEEYPCRMVVMDIIVLTSPNNDCSFEVFSQVSGFKPGVLFNILNPTKRDPEQEFNVDSSDDEDFQPNPHLLGKQKLLVPTCIASRKILVSPQQILIPKMPRREPPKPSLSRPLP